MDIMIDEQANALDANYRQQGSDRAKVVDNAARTRPPHVDPNGTAQAESLTLLAMAADQAIMSLGDEAETPQPDGIATC